MEGGLLPVGSVLSQLVLGLSFRKQSSSSFLRAVGVNGPAAGLSGSLGKSLNLSASVSSSVERRLLGATPLEGGAGAERVFGRGSTRYSSAGMGIVDSPHECVTKPSV